MWVYGIIAVLALNLSDYEGVCQADDPQGTVQTDRLEPAEDDAVRHDELLVSASAFPEVGPLPIDSALGYGVGAEDAETTDERGGLQTEPPDYEPRGVVCCEFGGFCTLFGGGCPAGTTEVECPCFDEV